jgi:hypothetical protein
MTLLLKSASIVPAEPFRTTLKPYCHRHRLHSTVRRQNPYGPTSATVNPVALAV